MVGVGLEDGIEIKDGYAQRLQIVQLLPDAPEVAPKEDVVGKGGAHVGRILRNAVFPILIQYGVLAQGDLSLTAEKAVGEDLIHRCAAKPLGCVKLRLVEQKAKALPALGGKREGDVVDAAAEERVPSAQKEQLVKEQAAARIGTELAGVQLQRVLVLPLRGAKEGKGQVAILSPVGRDAQHHRSHAHAARNAHQKAKARAKRERSRAVARLAVGPFVQFDLGARLNRGAVLEKHKPSPLSPCAKRA